ncbi:PREDICTED: uncharacterized protein LOC108567559 [Nicrophorus vespilloides]|uniref:Uncharacterized protein LOC108567559 n=1 Tax=Nicrophorus vespilloides TaxID=110193 RepID=A0ABM1N9U0_NICVS|nr:PREDICTED: uncharacterized protein LOC108567559 [Nicrophorus vespilloides]
MISCHNQHSINIAKYTSAHQVHHHSKIFWNSDKQKFDKTFWHICFGNLAPTDWFGTFWKRGNILHRLAAATTKNCSRLRTRGISPTTTNQFCKADCLCSL